MPGLKTISSRTLTLIIGIIVAIFLFLSVTIFQKESNEDIPDESTYTTSQTINMIHEGALNILSIIDRFK